MVLNWGTVIKQNTPSHPQQKVFFRTTKIAFKQSGHRPGKSAKIEKKTRANDYLGFKLYNSSSIHPVLNSVKLNGSGNFRRVRLTHDYSPAHRRYPRRRRHIEPAQPKNCQ